MQPHKEELNISPPLDDVAWVKINLPHCCDQQGVDEEEEGGLVLNEESSPLLLVTDDPLVESD